MTLKNTILKYSVMYKKMITLLAIFLLLVPGFLPHGFVNSSNKAAVNNLASHAKLCCCGNIASECRDCCCSESHKGTDNTGKHTAAITSCGGRPDDIFTTPNINYFFTQSVFLNYLPVTTLADTATLQTKDVLNRPPYKPPRLQLLTHFT